MHCATLSAGLIIGVFIKYTGVEIYRDVTVTNFNMSKLSKTIWINVVKENNSSQRYSYALAGRAQKSEAGTELEQKVVFVDVSTVSLTTPSPK